MRAVLFFPPPFLLVLYVFGSHRNSRACALAKPARPTELACALFTAADDFEDTDKWQNMGVLVVMVIIYRMLAYVHMVYKHTGRH